MNYKRLKKLLKCKVPYMKKLSQNAMKPIKRITQNQCMDFDDLIMNTIRLFNEQPDTLAFYQNKFHYIHVDEYQDTNHAQYTLVNLLAARFKNLCVVGDADQSIYGWRGRICKISWILKKIIQMPV